MNREVEIKSPLGEGALLFERMHGEERLGGGFAYELAVLSENHAIDLSELVGKPITLKMELPQEGERFFNAYVVNCSMEGTSHRHTRYRLSLRPWTYLLSLSSTSRIFPNMTVPEIILKIFGDEGFTDVRNSLHGKYRKMEYSVQYRESDLNYVNRLMEQEGIYTYFEHSKGKHTLVLADSVSAHSPAEHYEKVSYFAVDEDHEEHDDAIGHWSVGRQMRPGAFTSSDYDFTKPTAKLLTRLNHPMKQGHPNYEVYDYPGEFLNSAESQQHAKVRLEELQANFEVAHAGGTVHGIFAGALFTLEGHPRADQNIEYLVTAASFDIAGNAHDTGENEDKGFKGTYTCLNSQTQFRTHSRTPRPKVDGPQTATVVGKAGEEIYTDQYGRVKLKFHWDRDAKKDENSSCWVRVSQGWAGAQWGSMHIPRIGQEVIVDFLEGDPDRPIVTGRVYNGLQMPPYTLPENMTQSGIKSRSTPGGTPSNFNEIRFEDKKDAEELHVQAERDHSTLVKRNQSISVGADRSLSVGGNETISVTGTRSSTITKKETQTFKDDRMMTVAKTNTDEVTLLHTGTYKKGRTETVSAADDALTVNGANKLITVHGQFNTVADAQWQAKQKENSITIVDKITVTNAGQCTVALDGGKASITAASEISLTCGASSISMKSDGTIEIVGVKVKIGNANNNAAFEPTGTTLNGVKITSAAVGMHEVSGALIKIG